MSMALSQERTLGILEMTLPGKMFVLEIESSYFWARVRVLTLPNATAKVARLVTIARRIGFKQFEAGRIVIQIQRENHAPIAQIPESVAGFQKLYSLSNTCCLIRWLLGICAALKPWESSNWLFVRKSRQV
ncbi:hypothetical protein Nepgr_010849 [Nepenthes gracilis]|uniref:Uncharacterized protein n=1 Tax=Nepenthes gracilis TaxID=150966 RepID=A0AAD3SDQ4_NEPGR|nr:hypothetical protein Nepgr_010849 [Nepenthes gracilis]